VSPELTIVIPTKDRPQLLARAVDSALAQRDADVEVVVVDDHSVTPVALDERHGLRVLRMPEPSGGAAARNAGTAAARAPFVAYLDDDDELTPAFARVSLDAIAASALPPPVGALSVLQTVDPAGHVLETKVPAPSVRGSLYALEDPVPGRSPHAKQTLVVPVAVLESVGGWDAAFRSRVHTELFLRLNRVCSLDVAEVLTYRLLVHPGPRVSKDPELRQRSFDQLLRRHHDAFAARPRGAARFRLDHAEQSWRDGRRAAAVRSVGAAVRIAPLVAAREFVGRRLHRRSSGR
jgi:glycosyltransferase involved in cell wall biosynthesis